MMEALEVIPPLVLDEMIPFLVSRGSVMKTSVHGKLHFERTETLTGIRITGLGPVQIRRTKAEFTYDLGPI